MITFSLLEKYQNSGSRRRFFEFFAKANEFDPLIPDNWYNVSSANIVKHKVFPFYIFFIISFIFSNLFFHNQ